MDKALDKDTSFADTKRDEIRANINRFSRTRGGGESSLKFSSNPQDATKEGMSQSGKLLRDRFLKKETLLQNKMPSRRINWDEERGKRLEVSSFERDMNKKPNEKEDSSGKEDKKSDSYRSFQNL